MKINITIPVFNRPELTQITLMSLRRQNGRVPFDITVVDNGSKSDLQKLLIKYKEDNIIDNLFILDKNFGVSFASNIGLNLVGYDYYMKIDNDIVVNDREFIDKLFYIYSLVEPLSTLGPALLQRHLDSSKSMLDTKFGKITQCDTSLPGGALFIPKIIYDSIGGFSEDYGLYGGEDSDFGIRMSCAGFKQYYYECKQFFEHRGRFGNRDYIDEYIDKESERKRLYMLEDGSIGLLNVNYWLYFLRIRNLKVQRRYSLINIDKFFIL